jgi:hypothetical protein
MEHLLCQSLQNMQMWTDFGAILKDETRINKKDLLKRKQTKDKLQPYKENAGDESSPVFRLEEIQIR